MAMTAATRGTLGGLGHQLQCVQGLLQLCPSQMMPCDGAALLIAWLP